MTSTTQSANLWHRYRSWLFLVLGGLCIYGFYDIAPGYGDYNFPYGQGDVYIHTYELVMFVWYLTFGVPGVLCLSMALVYTAWPERFERWCRRLILSKRWWLWALLVLLVLVLLFWWWAILAGARLVDDENTYWFIAETLQMGRVTNPLPPDYAFYKNKFLIFNSKGWYGKYPIGFPALLAVGLKLGIPYLVNPLFTCLSMFLTYQIGVRLFSKSVAGLGVLLLLLSPHFVYTGATLLSQPASTAFMLLGFYIMLRVYETSRWTWAFAGGVVWGFGVLIRPMPGLLFLAAAALHYLWVMHQRGWKGQVWKNLRPLFIAAIPIALCAIAFLAVNRAQSGSSLVSGYHTVHRSFGVLRAKVGVMSSSLGGALLRENFWLLGWPLSFLFVFFARRGRYLSLFWGMIVADYAYRILVPKTVVSVTGPIYVTEAVPLLCLATAAGIVLLAQWFREQGWEWGRRWVISVAIASTVVAAFAFHPIHLPSVQESSETWERPFQMLRDQKAQKRLLVFANYMVPTTFDDSWAYHPPNPSPRLNNDIIFVRYPRSRGAKAQMKAFWEKHYPDRQAWLFFYNKRVPFLIKIGDPQTK